MIMVAVWLVTIMWYGKKIDDNTEAVNDFKDFIIEQVHLNGGFIMYMKMDDHE